MKPLYDVSTIETPEQIVVDLPLAGIGSRALAYLLDLLCQSLVVFAVGCVAFTVVLSSSWNKVFSPNAGYGQSVLTLAGVALFSFTVFVVNFGYFAFFEIVWRGQSPGKRTFRIRVVRDGGYPVDGTTVLVRNLLRVVDFLPALYLVGMLAIFIGRRGKRVGDYAAGTVVIHEIAEPDSVPAPSRPPPAPASGLTRAEAQLVNSFLERRAELATDARTKLAREIAARVSTRLGAEPPEDAESYLEKLSSHGQEQ